MHVKGGRRGTAGNRPLWVHVESGATVEAGAAAGAECGGGEMAGVLDRYAV